MYVFIDKQVVKEFKNFPCKILNYTSKDKSVVSFMFFLLFKASAPRNTISQKGFSHAFVSSV